MDVVVLFEAPHGNGMYLVYVFNDTVWSLIKNVLNDK